jgi:hypothetical protein
MKLEKKILLWTWIFRSLGLITSTAVVEQNWKWATGLGILMAGASEMKDYYLKKQKI